MGRKKEVYKDPRGGHIRLYWSLFDSVAFMALSNAEVRIYLAMRRQLGRTNNGDISAVLSQLRHFGVRSSSTLAKALRSLETVGLIEKTRQGGIANGGKTCSLYRFTDEPTLPMKKTGQPGGCATSDYLAFESLAVVRAKLRTAHLAAKRIDQIEAKTRKTKRTASMSAPEPAFSASNVVQLGARAVRESK